ncbi:hypothetical protein DLAC_09760 [Tieghemostelium lacteum]|uniref:Uncharacterized protein n=1 Tax=Tieghemostelium lacteum TaxID=361077 RepID=A0A151Z754_TIELA|nr:hypothetical protein DLAC_09760 [Tieghemostelium lacteum]|eukprot:KYQ89793.1 hypothetical protein DLAC_09760 [Tieghemostelium lacteum]
MTNTTKLPVLLIKDILQCYINDKINMSKKYSQWSSVNTSESILHFYKIFSLVSKEFRLLVTKLHYRYIRISLMSDISILLYLFDKGIPIDKTICYILSTAEKINSWNEKRLNGKSRYQLSYLNTKVVDIRNCNVQYSIDGLTSAINDIILSNKQYHGYQEFETLQMKMDTDLSLIVSKIADRYGIRGLQVQQLNSYNLYFQGPQCISKSLRKLVIEFNIKLSALPLKLPDFDIMLQCNPQLEKLKLKFVGGIRDYHTNLYVESLVRHPSLVSVNIDLLSSLENLVYYLNNNKVLRKLVSNVDVVFSEEDLKREIYNNTLEYLEVTFDSWILINVINLWKCPSAIKEINFIGGSDDLLFTQYHQNVTKLTIENRESENGANSAVIIKNLPNLKELIYSNTTDDVDLNAVIESICQHPSLEYLTVELMDEIILKIIEYPPPSLKFLSFCYGGDVNVLTDKLVENTSIPNLQFNGYFIGCSNLLPLFNILNKKTNLESFIFDPSENIDQSNESHIINYYQTNPNPLLPDQLYILGIDVWKCYYQSKLQDYK